MGVVDGYFGCGPGVRSGLWMALLEVVFLVVGLGYGLLMSFLGVFF